MKVEIKGTNFVNKGAELMLHAALCEIEDNLDNVEMVTDFTTGPYKERAKLGLYQKVWITRLNGFSNAVINSLLPASVCSKLGLIKDSDIKVVFDASGFAYSDQWGSFPAERMAKLTKYWKGQGKKVIMLPQAFGPFSTPEIKKSLVEMIENTDLIFARDPVSYKYLKELSNKDNIKLSPDFTNLLVGKWDSKYEFLIDRPCIVPNFRMIDKISNGKGDYLDFLKHSLEFLVLKGLNPYILIHDTGKDEELANTLIKETGIKFDVINEADPLLIKGIIGKSSLLISSRFHGLVSGLSQGVPSVACGWSHKYEMLFADYKCEDYILGIDSTRDKIFTCLSTLIDEEKYKNHKNMLIKESKVQKEKTKEMWKLVFSKIKY